MLSCSPPIIEREYTRLHRSEVYDLVSDDVGQGQQPIDGAYVYNGRWRIREVNYPIIDQSDVENLMASFLSDGWVLEGELSISPIIQGGSFFTVSAKLMKPEEL